MKLEYPSTKIDNFVEEIHGRKVKDPFRWLEDTSSEEVQEWIATQNRFSLEILKGYKGHQHMQERLTDLYHYDVIREGSFKVRKTINGVRFFYEFRKAGSDQTTLCYQDNEDGERIELVNLEDLSADSRFVIDWYFPSNDGALVAYGLSENGTEWSVLHIIDIERREILSERIPRTRYCDIVWLPDNSGFFYTRFPLVGTVSPEEENYNRHIHFHKIGDDCNDDVKVFGESCQPHDILYMSANADCSLLAVANYSTIKSDIYIAEIDIENPSSLEFIDMIVGHNAISIPILKEKTAYVLTQIEAPNSRIVAYDLNGLLKDGVLSEPRVLVQESEGVIVPEIILSWKFGIFGNRLAVIEDKDASSLLRIHDLETGTLLDTVEFEVPMTIHGVYSGEGLDQLYFDAQSYLIPSSFFYYASRDDRGVFFQPVQKLNPSDFTVKQIWYESKDGTKVSMFLVYKKDAQLSEETPVSLTGYGGFGYSLTPFYNPYDIPSLMTFSQLRSG
jgi:prolyl oligopeptidase